MTISKSRRHRGVVLTLTGFAKLAAAKSQLEIAENFGDRITFEAWGERTELNSRTIARIFGCTEGVDKRSLEQLFRVLNLKLEKGDYTEAKPQRDSSTGEVADTRMDWGEVVDVPVFYDRTKELAQLEYAILVEGTRLLAIVGMGGIGKTALAVKLAEQINCHFESVIWRSLRNAPPVQEILAELLQFLCPEQPPELSQSFNSQINQVVNCLHSVRCLVVLDNAESILGDGDYTGSYREGYEGYGELLRRVGETLVSGSSDCLLKFWDINTAQCKQTLQAHSHEILSVMFSPDGQTLASSSGDETIKLWDASTGKCLKTLKCEKPYEGMNIGDATGLTEVTLATLKALGAIEDRDSVRADVAKELSA